MSAIDDRIVALKFVNSQFEQGIAKSLSSIDKLKEGLNLKGATKSIEDLDAAGKKFSLAAMGDNIDHIASRFSALSVVAITAISNIVNKAVDAGLRLTKSLALGSVIDGYSDYNAKLTSVQTIMNATGASLETVNGYFKELDTYADKTIYNLTDMTGAFAKFTNAGIGMEKSVPAIKGIANMVALAGQDAGAASIAMYNLSQSLAGGFLTTTDYKSLNLANVATKEWKDNMIAAAVEAGKLKKGAGDAYTIAGSSSDKAYTSASLFNDALSEGWASADVLLGVLGDYGDITTEIGRKAFAAAQDVKSFGMMMDTLKAAAGTGWTDTFEIVVGNVTEAKALFTPLTLAIGDFIGKTAEARNFMLQTWKDLGGRDVLIDALKVAFQNLAKIMEPVKQAFQKLFPPVTGEQLFEFTNLIHRFAEGLAISGKQFNEIKRVATGFFSAIKLGIKIVVGVIGVIKDLFGAATEGSGTFLEVAAKVGDFFTRLNKSAEEGNKLTRFFNELSYYLQKPIDAIRTLLEWVGKMWDKLDLFSGSGPSDGLDRVQERFKNLGSIGETLDRIWASLWAWMQKVWTAFAPLRTALNQFFDKLGGKLGESLKNMDYNGILDMINTGLFAGLVLILKKFMKDGVNVDVGGGFLGSIKEALGGLTGVMKAMQTQLKADALMKIAIAIGVMTLSVVALSLIDSAALTKAITAIAFMMGELVGAMALLDKMNSTASAAKLALLAVGLTGIAGALLILSIAMKIISTMSWEEIAKGLTGVGVALGILAGFSKLMEKSEGPLIRTGAALIVLSVGLMAMSLALRSFAGMEWGDMMKGFAAVGIALALMAGFSKVMGNSAGALAGSAALLIVSGALLVLAEVVRQFGAMDLNTLSQGFAAIAAGLILIAFAVTEMSGALLGAASLAIVAAALWVIAPILQALGAMSWESIAKAAAALLATLTILAIAVAAMSVPILLVGAATMLIVAAALALLGPVLVAFGNMSWESIGKGLVMLAGALAVIGIAGALMTPVIPTLIGLGIAIGLIGLGVALAGAGLLAFSLGLTALSVAGAAGALAITAILAAVIGAIPQVFEAIANGIVGLAGILTNAAPVFLEAAVVFLTVLLTAIGIIIPKAVETIVILVMSLVNAIVTLVPFLVDAGYRLITGVINGIAKNVPGIIAAAVNLISNFITGIGQAATKLVNTAAETLITFLNGLASAIRRYTPQIQDAGLNIASAIIEGMTGGLSKGVSLVANKAKEVAQGALNAAKKLLGINSPSKEFTKIGEWSGEGMAIGLNSMTTAVSQAAENVGASAMEGLKSSLNSMDKVLSNGDMDMTPVIRPVLDLSDIQKGAKQIDGLLVPTSIIPTASYDKAASIAVDQRAQEQASSVAVMDAPTTEPTQVVFNQTNNSPKALSPAEIYRQTKNQISTAKGVLPS